MKKIISLHVVTILIASIVFFAVYYLLLQDNCDTSISSIINKSTNLDLRKHILVLGLVPIYIATVIFGAALLSIYLGSSLQQYLLKMCRDAKAQHRHECEFDLENSRVVRKI